MRFVRVLLSYSVDVSRKHSGDQILAQEVQQSQRSAAQKMIPVLARLPEWLAGITDRLQDLRRLP